MKDNVSCEFSRRSFLKEGGTFTVGAVLSPELLRKKGDNMNRIKIAMIGICHAHADAVLDEILLRNDLFDFVGYYDTVEEIKRKDPTIYNSKYKNLCLLDEEKILNNEYGLQAIAIETSMDKIYDYTNKYRKLNIPIHVDKPFNTSLEQFVELMDDLKEANIPIQIGYMFRYNLAVRKCLEYMDKGNDKIGTIFSVDAFMSTELYPVSRQELSSYPGGSMYSFGCHMLDLVLLLNYKQKGLDNCMPKSVATYLKQTGFLPGTNVMDADLAVLEYENGTAIVRTNAVEANGYSRRQLSVCGSNGTFEIQPFENPMKAYYAPRDGKNIYWDKKQEIKFDDDSKRRFEDMMTDFYNMANGKCDNLVFPVDYEYEKKLQELLLRACGVLTK